MPTIAPIATGAGRPTGSPGSSGCPGSDGRTEEKKTMSMRNRWTVLAAAMLVSGIAAAQTFPSRTIHLVSGVTPGSASDTTARIVAEKLQASLGQAVIVENKLGVGGLIGAAYVAKAEPDGHTISIYTSAFTVAAVLSPGPLDPKELTPVATLGTVRTVLVVATTAGIGSSTHMNLERFRISAGIEVLQVPMKGAPDALTEVLTGRADFYFALPFQVGPQVKEGKLRALAVGSPRRSALFPDVPTTVEAGYPNSDYNFWIGALIASRTPRDIVQRLNKEFNAAVSSPEVREKFLKLGVDPLTMSLPDFDTMIKQEFESNARLIKAAGIQAN